MKEKYQQHSQECNARLACEENTRKLYLNCNGDMFLKIKIDGGVESGNDCKKCDYLILKSDESIWLYVELKGRHIEDACEQILETHKKHNRKPNLADYYAAIISSKYPRIDTRIQRLETKMRSHKIRLFRKNDTLELSYNKETSLLEQKN